MMTSADLGLGLHDHLACQLALIVNLECSDNSLVKWLDDRCTVGREKQEQNVAQLKGSKAANFGL